MTRCIDPAKVHEIWPTVAPSIREAMRRGGLGSFAVVERGVLSGELLLWVADGGAAVTSLEQTEWKKFCVIVACAGRDVSQWLGGISEIEKFANAEGCQSVRIFGREGWVKLLPEYKRTRVVLEKEL